MPKIKRNSGFTLMEMMMVVAIITISAAVTGFSLKSMLPDLRLSQAARDLKSDLNMARLRAIKENKPVSITFDLDHQRYLVFIDIEGNGSLDAEDTLVKTVRMTHGISILSASFHFGEPWVKYDTRGLTYGFNGTAGMKNSKEKKQNVIVAQTGRITIEKD